MEGITILASEEYWEYTPISGYKVNMLLRLLWKPYFMPLTLNPKPETLNPQPQTPHPEP